MIKIALLQLSNSENLYENLVTIKSYLKEAKQKKANIAFLPENAAFICAPLKKYGDDAKILKDSEFFIAELRKQAKLLKIKISVGSVITKSEQKNKFYNSSIFIEDNGKITEQYNKIHLFDVKLPNGEIYKESARFKHGSEVKSLITKINKESLNLGLTICYDLRFPYLFRALSEKKKVQAISVPAAFTKTTGEAHWHTLLRARAIENSCYVIAAAQVGKHYGGRETFGHSLVIDPWGKIILDAGKKPGVYLAELDLKQVEMVRRHIPSLQHTRKIKA